MATALPGGETRTGSRTDRDRPAARTRGPDVVAVALDVSQRLARLHVPFVIGGSLASSVHGEPRSTLDIDMIVDVGLADVDRFVAALAPDYHLDRDATIEAIGVVSARRRGLRPALARRARHGRDSGSHARSRSPRRMGDSARRERPARAGARRRLGVSRACGGPAPRTPTAAIQRGYRRGMRGQPRKNAKSVTVTDGTITRSRRRSASTERS